MRKSSFILALTIMLAVFVGCAKTSKDLLEPLLGLSWFESYDDVKADLSSLEVIEERESEGEAEHQKMLDYTGTELFGVSCDLTLCFSRSGLIGLNYHDIDKNNSYPQWFSMLESRYGYPTEEGGGMASWYSDPLGKNTSVYLFNLEEGVQISFYASSSSPDKSYSGKGGDDEEAVEIYVPTPELRTPVVPVVVESAVQTGTISAAPVEVTDPDTGEVVAVIPDHAYSYSDIEDGDTTDESDETALSAEGSGENESAVVTTTVSGASGRSSVTTAKKGGVTTTTTQKKGASATTVSATTTTAAETVPVTTTTMRDMTNDFKLEGLQFYGSPDSERAKMSSYTQLYEYNIQEPGQPWELIMEYEKVKYCSRNCDAVLCFTSLGLVGINYFDPIASRYSYWVSQLTGIYGAPTDSQNDYTIWSNDPVGRGTIIYVFALEDGVQISFFADDTGSELA